MAMLAVDILIYTAIDAAISDLRKSPWLLDDCFGGLESDCFAVDPLAKTQYGMKEIAAAKQWFLNNSILCLLPYRTDSPEFPCVTITRGQSTELTNRATLADDGSIEDFDTREFVSIPQKIYHPFTPAAYDMSTGTVTFPAGIQTDIMSPGQFLVSAKSGKAYAIQKVTSGQTFIIAAGIADDFTGAYIAPQIALWNIHREQTFFQETFFIGCHAQSDPAQAIWLHQLISYILLRYKEAFLEGRGFEISTFSSDQMIQNPHFTSTEMVFTRTISLTGIVEASWAKFAAPRFHKVQGQVIIADGPHTPAGYQQQAQDEQIIMAADSTASTLPNNEMSTIYGPQHDVQEQDYAINDNIDTDLPLDLVVDTNMHSIGDDDDE